MSISPSSPIEAVGRAKSAVGAGFLRRQFACALFYLCWILFGILSFFWSLIADILNVVLPRALGNRVGRFVIAGGFRVFIGILKTCGLVKCDLSALEGIGKDTALIIAPNHPGRLDAFLMISRLPNAACITKAQIWKNIFLGGGARLAGYIRNDTPMNMVRRATEEVKAGRHLLVFPEGTRSARNSVGAFSGGFALIAKLSGAPIQTVFIECASGYLGKDWPTFKRPVFPIEFRVRLGRRFEPRGKVEAFVAGLEDYYRDELGSGSVAASISA